MSCIFCDETVKKMPPLGDYSDYKCYNCGPYTIAGGYVLPSDNLEDMTLLRGYVMKAKLSGNPIEPISEYLMKELKEKGKPSIEERCDLILKHIGDNTKDFGDTIRLDDKTSVEKTKYRNISYCHDDNNLSALFKHLDELGFISFKGGSSQRYWEIILKAKGFEKLSAPNANSKKVFVAMSFDKKLNNFYDMGIKAGIESAGFEPVRVDYIEHNGKICDKIIAEIKQARFVISDFTDHKNGVYFEAGFALGLGLEVIWTCKKGDIENLHFDTRQYNCLSWEGNEDTGYGDFSERLKNRILALV